MTDAMQRTVVLIDRAKEGDREAENELVARYMGRVMTQVRLRLRGDLRRLCDSGDVAQEVFVKTMRNLEGFQMRSEGSFLHYLSSAVANHIRDLADKGRADRRDMRREVAMDAAAEGQSGPQLQLPDRGGTPSQDVGRRELAEIMAACLEQLDEDKRELVLMRNYSEMSWQEIGEFMGLSADAARMQHGTARVALARCLRSRGIDPNASL